MDSKTLLKSSFTNPVHMVTGKPLENLEDKVFYYLKYLLGGGLIGAGAASGTNLMHMLNSARVKKQKQREEEENVDKIDDNTLVINLPTSKIKDAEVIGPDHKPTITTTKQSTNIVTAGNNQFRGPRGKYGSKLRSDWKKNAQLKLSPGWEQKLLAW
ncbi:hypothetical protein ACFLQL_04075, partial [Verrucomicrobiota bacterium]